MLVKRFLNLFVITLLTALSATGQVPTPSPQKTEPSELTKGEAQVQLNTQAYDLLDAIIKDVQRLRLPQNRIFLSVTAGDLMWKRDEQAARALFKDAIADLRGMLTEPNENDGAPAVRQAMERGQLREKVLFALAPHDSRMALDLLAETRPVKGSKESGLPDSEIDLETRLASVIAANDPVRTLEMARKSMAKGFSYTLPNLLVDIKQKDPTAASELASDIVAKLKTANLATDLEAGHVAIRIFQMATEPSDPKGASGAKETKPLLSESSLRELAELIAAAALSEPAENAGRTLNIGSVMTQLEKYAPSRVQQLRRLNAQAGGGTDEQQSYQTYQKLVETGNADALIAAAEKADAGMRESYYRQAALKLASEERIDQARQIVTQHIAEPEQRKQLLAELDKQVLASAASKGKMEETRKLLQTATTNEERIAILTQLAVSIAEKGDKKVALQLLEEARALSSGRARYSRQLFARLQIIRAYATVDPAQSLAILEPTIDQLNELIGAGIILGEFLGEEEFVRDDEVLVVFVGQLADMFQQQYGKDLRLVAAADFPRTRDAAERFQRFEVRIMARLLVVQSILGQKEDESRMATPAASDTPVAVAP
jgi:hypothetical protein